MASLDEFRIAKLTADNYHTWSIRTKAALVQKGCWEAVVPGYSYAEMTEDQRKSNNKALTILFLVVEDSYLDDIGTCLSAKDAWDILREIHTKYGLLHVLQLLRDFVNVKKKYDEPMKEYLSRLTDLHRKLSNGGYGFTDKELALVMLLGLPETYEPLILKLEQDEATLTTKEVKARLLVEEKRKQRREEEQMTETVCEPKALVTKDKPMLRHDKTMEGNRPEQRVRYREGGRKVFPKEGNAGTKRRVRCFACGRLGHIARDCEADDCEENYRPSFRDGASHARKATHTALSAKIGGSTRNSVWYLDSGATEHMTSDKTKFVEFHPCTSTVEAADGEVMQALGKGEVKFQLQGEYGGNFVTLKEVLYVPALDGNLLSVGRIEERGFRVIFSNGRGEVWKNGEDRILSAVRTGRLYIAEEVGPSSRLAIESNDGDALLWHRRLGHLHQDAVHLLCGETSCTKAERCSTCVQGKLRRSSFPKSSIASRAEAPLQLIHSDVGKVTPRSKGGSNYFVTFVDDYSRYVVVYPMKTKAEVLEKFDRYRRMVENQHGTTVQVLRSDNGGEYVGKEFQQYLIKHGIRRQLTVPGTPQQNGVAERINQTLLDMTRCVLIESGVPKTLWADAITTAAHIRNRCPSKAIASKIPEELWLGKKTRVDHLRVYGCRAWSVQQTRYRRTKLDPKATECVLVGYPEGVKGYKLWDRKTDKFFLSRNVVFDENISPCKTLEQEMKPLELPARKKAQPTRKVWRQYCWTR